MDIRVIEARFAAAVGIVLIGACSLEMSRFFVTHYRNLCYSVTPILSLYIKSDGPGANSVEI